MKIVILTSDIIDGVIISERIVLSGNDVKAIFYEKKQRSFKGNVKRALYMLFGKMKNYSFEGLKRYSNLEVYPVTDINSTEVESALQKINPDLMIVIGTRKLNKRIFGAATHGTINMHSGILPYYRGADSEFWALYNGEKDKIGITIHFIDEDLDTGDIILTARQNVLDTDDHKTLRMKNIFLGAQKIVEVIGLIESGEYDRIPQDNSVAKTYKSATASDIGKLRLKI